MTTYGFWLPNDPRGSGSTFVGSRALYEHGKATKVNTRRSVAHKKHDVAARFAAKADLVRPPVILTGLQARAVGRGFAYSVQRLSLTIHACAIMPDHAHLVVARAAVDIEAVIRRLKGDASRQLLAEGLHPFANNRSTRGILPSAWTDGSRKIFLGSGREILNRIRYVENNPFRAGLPRQKWSFVVPYSPSCAT